MKRIEEKGIALATTLIVLFLVVGLVVGFSWMVMVDQKLGGVNGNQQYAFYAAEAGLEKLTANIGFLFTANPSPSAAQVHTIDTAANVPAIPGIQYVKPDGTLGYNITFPQDAAGDPLAQFHAIGSGLYQGMNGLLTPFTLQVTARTIGGNSEVRLERNIQTVAIPVFQFGMFSQTDLSYFPGPTFNFGGRVQTNGNLFLAGGSNLIFGDKVFAAGDIVRAQLSNTHLTSAGYTGNVYIPTTSGGCPGPPTVPAGSTAACRQLALNEGSVVAGAGSGPNANWSAGTNISGQYNGYLRANVKPLDLSITLGLNKNVYPIDLIRRAPPGEDASDPTTLAQRYYSEASIRILISDNPSDITGLPCEDTSVAPTPLAAGSTFGGVPIAASGAGASYNASNGYWNAAGTPTLGAGVPSGGTPTAGYIKIEIQTTYAASPAPCGTWKDVTAQVLGYGIAGRNLDPANYSGTSGWGNVIPPLPGAQIPPSPCADPNPNSIIRLERLRDNPSTASSGSQCGGLSTKATDYWPNALFDTREGNFRDDCPDGTNPNSTPCLSQKPALGGVMNYVELDVNNLAQYLTGALAGSGASAKDPKNSSYDFTVYFSDRRGNYTPAALPGWPPASPSGNETGEYGFEDSINYASQHACPDNTLDQAEVFDVVENGTNQAVGGAPESYGASLLNPLIPPPLPGISAAGGAPVLSANPNCAAPAISAPSGIWPGTYANSAQEARENPPLFFRRALKIVNGSSINLGTCPDGQPCGLTIVSENPVYVQGDFNAIPGSATPFTGAHVATSIISDALTLLSDKWNDVNSFAFPYNIAQRQATSTGYRFGVVAGKGISFPYPGYGSYQDFGTDGGVHNFLRFLERWSGDTVYYHGSVVSLYYSRQATGVYKDGRSNDTVYSPPGRGYQFDSDFLTPSKLPPRTPMFRDVNTIGFTQTVLPTK